MIKRNSIGTAIPRKAPRTVARLLAAIWLCSAAGWGSDAAIHPEHYTIQNWQLEHGLPHISVSSIAQTPDGYLWVGTFGGLARFDGVRFTVFNGNNAPALGRGAITQLQTDSSGALWIVTLDGRLVRLADDGFKLVASDKARFLVSSSAATESSPPELLLRDCDGQRRRIEQGQLRPADSFAADERPRFLFENSSLAWVAQQGRLLEAHKTTFPVRMGDDHGGQETSVVAHAAAPRQAGGYWVATSDGVFRLEHGRLSARVAPLPAPVQGQMSLTEDGAGVLWAGKWGEGLFRLSADGSWRHFRSGVDLADDHVTLLFRDREGNLWVGTGQGGLHRIRPASFQVFGTEGGPQVVMSLTQDRLGRLWFAVNDGGLHTWTEGQLKPVVEPAELRTSPLAYSVLADRQDAVWIGLYGNAVLRWQADVLQRYGLNRGSPFLAMTPRALLEDRSGRIWMGCTHGLVRYEGGRLSHFTAAEGLSCEGVLALAEDRSGTLFVGTDGGGLNCFRDGRFTVYTEREGLTDDHVAALFMDREDTLWVGTANQGLCRFRQGRFAGASGRDGLLADTIGTVIDDSLGNLWLGSNRGIVRVNRAELNDYLDGKQPRVAWRHFGLSDGLPTLGCTGGGQPASGRTADGRLWFATIKGAATVDPDRLSFNRLPPPVVIEEVVVDDQVQLFPGKGSNSITLTPHDFGGAAAANIAPAVSVPPRAQRIEFRFTGLSLMAAEQNRFRYRLDPFDDDWVQAGTRRVAYYTGLPAGSYQFRVTACNNDGVWNEDGVALGVTVLPPWWRTWWFQFLVALGVAGLVFGGYELRLFKLRRESAAHEEFSRQLIASQESERRRLAGELHDGMGQDLLVIASQAQLSLAREDNSAGATARLNEIAETARRAIHQARRMAHDLRPGLIEELGFTKAVRACADRAAQAAEIPLALQVADVDGLLSPEFEVNLFRMLQETLSNILKHARASELKVTLERRDSGLCLVVEDNGRGFDPTSGEAAAAGRRGFGMRQLAERAKLMGGRVDVQSQPGAGTRVTVEVPLDQSRDSR